MGDGAWVEVNFLNWTKALSGSLDHCCLSRGLMVRDARRRAPRHEGLRPHPEEHREAMRLEG